MTISQRFAAVGKLPPRRTDEALAVLDAMTGGRNATMLLLEGDHRPGAGLAGTMATEQPIQHVQGGGAATPGTRPVQPQLGMDPAARRAIEQAGGGLVIGGAGIAAEQALREAREHRSGAEAEQAFDRFRLDRAKVADVFAARAYAWAKVYGPWAYFWYFSYRLGWSGPENEAFAQALMRHEREYPGTLGAAVVQNRQEAWDVITGLLERSSAAISADPGLVLERDRISDVDDALSARQSRYYKEVDVPTPGVWRIHHLIPFAVVRDLPAPVQRAFVTAGWSMDRGENIIPLPGNAETYRGEPNFSILPTHVGSHSQYNTLVAQWIIPIAAHAVQISPTQLLTELSELEKALRAYLLLRLSRVHPRLL